MRVVDLRKKVPGYNRVPDAHKAAREGEQVLLVSEVRGRLAGVLLDRDILRLTTTVRELLTGTEHMPKLKVMTGGLYGVNLGPEAVAKAAGW